MTSVIHVGLRSCRAHTVAHTVAILKLELICLENCVYKLSSIYFLLEQGLLCLHNTWGSNAVSVLMRWRWTETSPLCYCGNRRDLWPLTSPLRLSTGWLSQRLCGPPDHKHSPWAWWTVMDGNPWAVRSAESAPYGVNRLTLHRCGYVDEHVWMQCHGVIPLSLNKQFLEVCLAQIK